MRKGKISDTEKARKRSKRLNKKFSGLVDFDPNMSSDSEVDHDVRWVFGARWGTVVDVLFINTIEKLLNRKLDEYELDALRHGEPLFYQDGSGRWDSCVVDSYVFPNQVQLNLKDLTNAMVVNEKLKKVFVLFEGVSNANH